MLLQSVCLFRKTKLLSASDDNDDSNKNNNNYDIGNDEHCKCLKLCCTLCRVLLFVDEADAFLRKRSQVIDLFVDLAIGEFNN